MEIIEYFLKAKTGNERDCEDQIVVTDHFAAVIDGVTNVSGCFYDGEAPGRLAAETIKNTIRGLDERDSIKEVVDKINIDLHRLNRKIGIAEEVDDVPHLRPSAAMILYSRHYRKIWMIGDCQCFLEGNALQNTKIIDDITANARAMMVEAQLVKGKTEKELLSHDMGFEAVKPFIQQQFAFQNGDPAHPYSYEVINGYPLHVEAIKTVDVPTDTGYLCLASDGYPMIFETFEETEAHLQELLVKDPLCIRENPSAKGLVEGNVSFDDRAFVKIRI
ncbi:MULTISPECIES: hypothetical protein [Alteribacter]|uniref:PPM-type phosphatase domain-containing protein n=1 Tax=Alteribacter keqinensis TaxID=2483800 RepID=A0A3M7TQ81_9BACI|nr:MULTISPECIES: hypothetical protein [Alteribacter]MBM7095697.1 hypothetical protein [Alteribacter salitolerans]RNA67718.1 hypothetical protein EBO34_13455 [Alteribacter keqinensis]